MNRDTFTETLLDMIHRPDQYRDVIDELHNAWMELDNIENDDNAAEIADRLGAILDAFDPLG